MKATLKERKENIFLPFYHNLLKDSLKNGCGHVISLYDKLQNNCEDKYLNIVSGNFAIFKLGDKNNIYKKHSKYPIMYKNGCIGRYYRDDILKILDKYCDWLDDYDIHHDEDKLRKLINKEIEEDEDDQVFELNIGTGGKEKGRTIKRESMIMKKEKFEPYVKKENIFLKKEEENFPFKFKEEEKYFPMKKRKKDENAYKKREKEEGGNYEKEEENESKDEEEKEDEEEVNDSEEEGEEEEVEKEEVEKEEVEKEEEEVKESEKEVEEKEEDEEVEDENEEEEEEVEDEDEKEEEGADFEESEENYVEENNIRRKKKQKGCRHRQLKLGNISERNAKIAKKPQIFILNKNKPKKIDRIIILSDNESENESFDEIKNRNFKKNIRKKKSQNYLKKNQKKIKNLNLIVVASDSNESDDDNNEVFKKGRKIFCYERKLSRR